MAGNGTNARLRATLAARSVAPPCKPGYLGLQTFNRDTLQGSETDMSDHDLAPEAQKTTFSGMMAIAIHVLALLCGMIVLLLNNT